MNTKKLLQYLFSALFWLLLIAAAVIMSTGIESKFIYTDF